MNWEEIKDGYGLDEIPMPARRDYCCSWCLTPGNGRIKLWTDQPARVARGHTEYNRNRIWCRYHAEQFFGD